MTDKPHRLAFRQIGLLYHPKLAESRVMAAGSPFPSS